MSKLKAKNVAIGSKVKIGKSEVEVTDVKIIDVPVTRIVKTVVLEYRKKDDDEDASVFYKHLSGDDKVEVLKTKWERIKEIIWTPSTPKKGSPLDSKANNDALPFFVKNRAA